MKMPSRLYGESNEEYYKRLFPYKKNVDAEWIDKFIERSESFQAELEELLEKYNVSINGCCSEFGDVTVNFLDIESGFEIHSI